MRLPKKFYARNPAVVAREILGNILCKKDHSPLEGRIVETEAYYGLADPASRAFKGKKNFNKWMWDEAGALFIYMVHGNWLLNIITEKRGIPSGILIRAVEPLTGIDTMQERRQTDIRNLTSGPGKLTQAFGITKKHNGVRVYDPSSDIFITKDEKQAVIKTSARIGVKEDLPYPLRFFIENNQFVSR
jgi:DNA-3-methyladenine glycosylase